MPAGAEKAQPFSKAAARSRLMRVHRNALINNGPCDKGDIVETLFKVHLSRTMPAKSPASRPRAANIKMPASTQLGVRLFISAKIESLVYDELCFHPWRRVGKELYIGHNHVNRPCWFPN